MISIYFHVRAHSIIVILCEWLVFLILYILSKLWLIIQKVSLMISFLVNYAHLLHLWKFIYLAYVLKTFKIFSKYWCSSYHMYVRLSIGPTQIIYYNKHWPRIVLCNVKFLQYLSRHVMCIHLVFPALQVWAWPNVCNIAMSGLSEFLATLTFKCFGLVAVAHNKQWQPQIASLWPLISYGFQLQQTVAAEGSKWPLCDLN